MSKQAKLTLTDNDPDHPGVLMHYTDPKPGFSFSDLCALLLGVGIAAVSIAFIVDWQWPSSLVGVLICVTLGGAIATCAWDNLAACRKGLDLWYRVSVADGVAIFDYSGDKTPVMLTLGKIGRIWIQQETKRGYGVISVHIKAYYDGQERVITNITQLWEKIGDDNDSLLIEHIVEYLNRHRDRLKKEKKQLATPDRATIQCGYRHDYAIDTPQSARNLCTLAAAKYRGFCAGAFALTIYAISLSPLIPTEIQYFILLAVLLPGFVLAMLYSVAASRLGACHCRQDAFGIVVAMAAGLLLHLPVYYARENLAVNWPVYLEPLAILPLMSWIIYRYLSGCDCGANKAKQPAAGSSKKKGRR